MEIETIEEADVISGMGWQQHHPSHSIHVLTLEAYTSSKWTTLYCQCRAQTVSGELSSPERYSQGLWSPMWSVSANPSPKRMTSAFVQTIHRNSSATMTLGTISRQRQDWVFKHQLSGLMIGRRMTHLNLEGFIAICMCNIVPFNTEVCSIWGPVILMPWEATYSRG